MAISFYRTVSALTVLIALAACGGCHVAFPGREAGGPVPKIPPTIPKELAKVSLPDYIIEPPDVLTIEAVTLLPKQPYALRPLDLVAVVTKGLPEEQNVAGEFAVQPDGSLQLGFSLGTVQAAGKTAEQLQADLLTLLQQNYREPSVVVTLLQMAAQQQIAGDHLVAPDGKVNLGTYGGACGWWV